MQLRQLIILTALFLAFSLVGPIFLEADEAYISIYTVNYPLKYFAERIGGEHVEVVFPAPPDVDPAYWMPDRKTITEYQQADLILLNGAEYAKWTEKVTLPRSKMVDTSRKFRDRYVYAKDAVTHSHGPGGEHAHESLAFTTWLDFELAAKQAKAVVDALVREEPDHKQVFQQNFVQLEKDLLGLDQKMKQVASENPKTPLVASHPVYQYLANRYGLNIQSVHWEPDEVPSQEQWLALQRILKEHSAQWMLWEDAPLKQSAEGLRSVGIQSIIFAPCGNVPAEGDFMDVMRRNVENLEKAFK
jgi:zinc transport system substrate-binding protein